MSSGPSFWDLRIFFRGVARGRGGLSIRKSFFESFHGAGHPFEILVQGLHIRAARKIQQFEYAFDGLLYRVLEFRMRLEESPPARGFFAAAIFSARSFFRRGLPGFPLRWIHQATDTLLEVSDAFAGVIHSPAQCVVERIAALLEDLGKQAIGRRGVAAVAIEQDLGKGDRGDVLPAFLVDDADLLPRIEEFRDALQRDVGCCRYCRAFDSRSV